MKVTLKFGSSQTVSSLNPRKFDEKITKCSNIQVLKEKTKGGTILFS